MTLVTVAGMAAVTKHPIHLWPLLVIGSDTWFSHNGRWTGDGGGNGCEYDVIGGCGWGKGDAADVYGGGWGDTTRGDGAGNGWGVEEYD
jgi:hypothetical protein